jgi:hypothetical protein
VRLRRRLRRATSSAARARPEHEPYDQLTSQLWHDRAVADVVEAECGCTYCTSPNAKRRSERERLQEHGTTGETAEVYGRAPWKRGTLRPTHIMAGVEQADFVFAHLSDIHFRKGRAGDLHDEDADLRNELEFDLRNSPTLVPRIDAIIVSGDIAFGGQAVEYQTAGAWLRSIAEQVNCPEGRILVTPGNHDVNRDQLPAESEVVGFHRTVQTALTIEERDAMIAGCLRDPAKGPELFAPLHNYNAFAQEHGCAVTPEAPYWEKNFPLGDGSSLCVRGMSTTIISGPLDDAYPQNLVYGGAQKTFLRSPGVRRMLVGHHPPSWTSDNDSAAQVFSKRNLIQLYGHRHAQWIAKDENCVRIIAGAVHPDRREAGWEPRYNLVALTVTTPTTLRVRVFPRRWSREEMVFVPDRLGDGSIDRVHTLTIDKFSRPAHVQEPKTTHTPLAQWGAIAERLQRYAAKTIQDTATELGLFFKPGEPLLAFISAAVTAGKLADLESKLGALEAGTPKQGNER